MDGFSAAGELSPGDRAAQADAAWWLGQNDKALRGFEDAFRGHLDAGQPARAAVLALDIAFLWNLRGEPALASGWTSRGRRLLADLPGCAEQGYGMLVDLEEALASGDHGGALTMAQQIAELAGEHGDTTLAAMALACQGVALVAAGMVGEGMAALDEAMLPVAAGQVRPDWAGNLYCRMIGVCHDVGDVRRAQRWTEVTERWCHGLSPAVMFAGVCRMHRAQLLQLQGAWATAEEEAARVCRDLAGMNLGAVAESHYQIGEIFRMRGDLAAAERAYRSAHETGRDPQPGLALVRMTQGRVDEAASSIDNSLTAGSTGAFGRAQLLAACIEISLRGDEIARAGEATAALEEIAATHASTVFEAMAAQGRGSVLLAQGRHGDALAQLRGAARLWTEAEVPYEIGRTRTLAAQACRELGDGMTADLELDAAAAIFERLGALADLARLAELRPVRRYPAGLTAREVEVLSCVAAGQSNREVAATLFIADKTVARHLSNIFAKLGVSSRTEAAAFAYQHHLVGHRRS